MTWRFRRGFGVGNHVGGIGFCVLADLPLEPLELRDRLRGTRRGHQVRDRSSVPLHVGENLRDRVGSSLGALLII